MEDCALLPESITGHRGFEIQTRIFGYIHDTQIRTQLSIPKSERHSRLEIDCKFIQNTTISDVLYVYASEKKIHTNECRNIFIQACIK